MNKYKFTFGADPEFFVQTKKEEEVVPACRLFGGDKGSPMFLSPDGGYLEDGTTVEFNVSPCSSLTEVRSKLENLILVFLNKYDKYELSPYSSATFSKETLDRFPEACHIGCAPDLFAYGLRIAPSIAKFRNRRFAGGHIHVGIDPWPEGLDKKTLIQFMDLLFLGEAIPKYTDNARWEFYGHPGLYRETNYGVEHRSPDNYWCNPARFAQMDLNARKWVQEHVMCFDRAFQNLEEILNFDGHGARVEVDMAAFIKASNIENLMSTLSVYDNPNKARNLIGFSGESEHFTRRWSAERMTLRKNRAAPKGLVE